MGRAVVSSPLAVGGKSALALLSRFSVAVLWVYLLAVTCGAESADSLPVSSPIMGSSSPPGPGFASLGARNEKPNGVSDGSEFYCFRSFKRCRSGINQCIKPEQECDGVKDCYDGSDEGQFCESFNCTDSNRYMCPSGKMCMNVTNGYGGWSWRYNHRDPYTAYLCDGVKDCLDGSDEDETFCGAYDCNSNVPHKMVARTLEGSQPRSLRVQCPGGKSGCVYESQLCDGTVNCVTTAGSDESDELCKKRGCSSFATFSRRMFQCRTGKCIQGQRMCDGKKDCPDGDDEGEFCARLNCPNYGIKCNDTKNQTCIQESQVCDGVLDCPGGTDEADCATIECNFGQTKCPNGEECAYVTLCNGVKDCKDGSDEDPAFCRHFNCSADERTKCKDGLQCVDRRNFCNGEPDCLDLSDEDPAFCRTYNCSEGEDGSINCPGGGYVWCVYGDFLCAGPDGFQNQCYLGNDKDPTFCASKEARDILAEFDRIACSNNQTNYIYGNYCDGIRDCADGSDERDSFCKAYKCPRNRVRCYDKWCFRGGKCDGNWDCPDGSDEQNC